tara:strand:- start:19831 stop:20427 length:597 start_codon:yes stop_codon:yes gene_type:complete
MARRNFAASDRPQHRTSVVPESVEPGSYRAFITQLAVRNTPSKKTGEDEEKMLIRFRLEGETIDRAEWFPLSWAALDNPNGDNPALWNLFNDIGYATKAEPAKNAEDGPNIFEISDDGEEYRAAIGDYKLARPTVILEIEQRLAKNSFERDTRADENGLLNTITEAKAAPKKKKNPKQKVAAKTAAKAAATVAEEIPF